MSIDIASLAESPGDTSWSDAHDFVAQKIRLPSHVQRLFRQAWLGILDQDEFFKILGFSRLSLPLLMEVAEVNRSEAESLREATQQSLMVLGIRLTAVVLAVDYISKQCLTPSLPGDVEFLKEMMTDIEVGYYMGAKTVDLGLEGGALLGFSRSAGKLLARKAAPQLKRALLGDVEVKGAPFQSYQLSACLLQRLGFGTDIAIGMALGAKKFSAKQMELSRDILRWKAGYEWIDSLRRGRNYPSNTESRSFFPEIDPPSPGDRNIRLEVLYTEVSKIAKGNPKWCWVKLKDETQLVASSSS